MNMEMNLNSTDGFLTLERNIDLVIDGELAYWMRWGMDNIGNEDPGLSLPLRIFNSGILAKRTEGIGLLTMLKEVNSRINWLT